VRYLNWMGFDPGVPPLEELARTGGEHVTDSLQIYSCPTKTEDGKYETHFFCHGIRHLRGNVPQEISTLDIGQKLLPMFDLLNSFDEQAVALRTSDPAMMIGYCPRFLARDVRELVSAAKETFDVKVEQINVDAPIQFRLLCRLTATWPDGFYPCSEVTFQPISPRSGTPTERIVG
jgi:hypothetical protein